MKVKDVMTKNVACISPQSTVIEAARLMQKHNIGVIPVCDATRMVGIVTDRDIVVRNIANGTGVDKEVRDIMTSDVKTVTKDMDVEDATDIMSASQVRRLPVVENNKVVGMVSIGDIATISNRSSRQAGETLADISTPSNPMNVDAR